MPALTVVSDYKGKYFSELPEEIRTGGIWLERPSSTSDYFLFRRLLYTVEADGEISEITKLCWS